MERRAGREEMPEGKKTEERKGGWRSGEGGWRSGGEAGGAGCKPGGGGCKQKLKEKVWLFLQNVVLLCPTINQEENDEG